MKRSIARGTLIPTCLTLVLGVISPLRAQASHCSTVGTAGKWAYTYTGTIFSPNGPLPAASVGRFTEDVSGNLTAHPDPQCGRKFRNRRHYRDGQCEPRLHGHSNHQCVCKWTAAAHRRAGCSLRRKHEPCPRHFRVPGLAEWHERSRGPYFR